MEEKKDKETENKNEITYCLGALICKGCKCFKQMIRRVEFFADGQIRLVLLCDVCGLNGFHDLFDERYLPSIETKVEPDARQLALKKVQTQRLKDIKKKEKEQVRQRL